MVFVGTLRPLLFFVKLGTGTGSVARARIARAASLLGSSGLLLGSGGGSVFALDMLSEKEISVSEVSLRLFAPLSSPSSSDSTSEIGRFRPAVGGGGLGFLTSLPLPLLTLPLGLPRGRGDCVCVFSVSESFWSTLRNDGRGPLGVV